MNSNHPHRHHFGLIRPISHADSSDFVIWKWINFLLDFPLEPLIALLLWLWQVLLPLTDSAAVLVTLGKMFHQYPEVLCFRWCFEYFNNLSKRQDKWIYLVFHLISVLLETRITISGLLILSNTWEFENLITVGDSLRFCFLLNLIYIYIYLLLVTFGRINIKSYLVPHRASGN